MTKLSIVIPAYNEEKTIEKCVERVLAIANPELQLELIIIDDASADQTAAIATTLAEKYDNVRFFRHEYNQGKGAALHLGFAQATGDLLVVQDADLECDPQELLQLIRPIIEGRADIVYGSRFLYATERQVQRFWHRLANKILTSFCNMFTNRYFSDMMTCYKVFKKDLLKHITLCEKRFAFDTEFTIKVCALRINGKPLKITEMPISYHWRTHDEGKKIGWKDGVRAVYVIIKYSVFAKSKSVRK